jgi:hypothetical protein
VKTQSKPNNNRGPGGKGGRGGQGHGGRSASDNRNIFGVMT